MNTKLKIFLSSSAVLIVSLELLRQVNRTEFHPRSISALNMMAPLTFACEDFHESYQRLPGQADTSTDKLRQTTALPGEELTGSLFLAELVGLPVAEEGNPKLLDFLSCSKLAQHQKNGILIDHEKAELFDPWANPYYLLLDYNNDKQLKCPFTGKIISGEYVLVWSLGRDGQSGTPATDEDNICSWKLK